MSGISYFTHRLAIALETRYEVSVLLIRKLLPSRFYPGRAHVNKPLVSLEYPDTLRVYDGVDWYWGTSMLRALLFLRRVRPQILLLEWWTGTALHTFLLISSIARRLGSRVLVEMHEVQDTGEINLPVVGLLVRAYVDTFLPLLLRRSDGIVVHSQFDRDAVAARFGNIGVPIAVVRHGPVDRYVSRVERQDRSANDEINVLFLGVIRPFKGLEDLLEAFARLEPDEVGRYRLTVVGETWEGWTLPAQLIDRHRYRDRITFVNRYVDDDEIVQYLERADAMALPYHRSSSSGPLHLAMSQGLPVIVSEVGGLTEATRGYKGAVLVPPRHPEAITAALRALDEMCGQRYEDPWSWTDVVDEFEKLFCPTASMGSSPR